MKKLKESRTFSFVAIFLIYLICGAGGILCYRELALPYPLALLIADVIATVIAFIFSLIFSNASVYDPYWSVQPPVILIAFAVGRELTLLGVLLLVAVSFWAIRLTANWAYTFRGLTHQDWRYTMLSEKTGAFYPFVNFLGIHLVPTLVVYACTMPAVYAICEGLSAGPLSVVFVAISFLAALMQGVADIEMHRFRKNGTGGFIRYGLWKYSRHPNYLGEILMWWGVGLAVFSAAPTEWYLLLGAVSNTLLFLFISIPMAEKRQGRKEGFNEYKAETRMLLPLKR